jgi:hypothetical protein
MPLTGDLQHLLKRLRPMMMPNNRPSEADVFPLFVHPPVPTPHCLFLRTSIANRPSYYAFVQQLTMASLRTLSDPSRRSNLVPYTRPSSPTHSQQTPANDMLPLTSHQRSVGLSAHPDFLTVVLCTTILPWHIFSPSFAERHRAARTQYHTPSITPPFRSPDVSPPREM